MYHNAPSIYWRIIYQDQVIFANQFHLNCFVDIERKPGSVTEKEDDHDGEQEGSHSGVPPVALGDAVVDQGGPIGGYEMH